VNIFGILSSLTVLTNLGIAFFLFFNGKKKSSVLFSLVTGGLSLWALGCAGFSSIPQAHYDEALFWFMVGYSGVIFIPILYAHFVFSFLGLDRKKLLTTMYTLGLFFLVCNWFEKSTFFVGKLFYVFDKFYWMNWMESRTWLWIIFYIGFYWILLMYAFFLLLKQYRQSSIAGRRPLRYLIIGSVIGWVGGELQFLPSLGIYSFKTMIVAGILTAIYPSIITYGIIKHRLMDLKVAITRTSIFVFVYSLVLGIPFWVGFAWQESLNGVFGEIWWIVPLLFSTVLATGGPFIYVYLQTRTEDRIYKNQRQYQNTLRKASLGMGRIKDLKRLLTLIVHVVTRTVKIEHCSIYVFHEASGQFVLKAKKGKMKGENINSAFSKTTTLIEYLGEVKDPISYSEIKQLSEDYENSVYASLSSTLKMLDAALVLPSFVEHRLIAFLVLGRKKSKEVYNHEDLVVFSILANQSGLAIENAQFYEDMKKTHAKLFKAEKMATIGTMADGLSHQMNNRLHAMGFIAGDAMDSIKIKRLKNIPEDNLKFLDEMEYALKRIEENVKRGGEIAEGLLRYTRKGAEGFSSVNLNKLIDAALEMIQFKIDMRHLDLVREIDTDFPPIKGNFTQLQEAFFNMIDNAYDAMMQRRDELEETGYRPKMVIFAIKKGKNVEIVISDNGIGVKEEDISKLFAPFFTTKLSSKKGTGLGLYVIRQIIEENHNGRVNIVSKYKEGSRTIIILPVAHED